MIVVEMLKNDKTRASDLPQLKQYISAFERHLQDTEKNKLRMLNQIQERANALVDKFSLHTIMRRTNLLRKFMR